jgi:hypothetical protein
MPGAEWRAGAPHRVPRESRPGRRGRGRGSAPAAPAGSPAPQSGQSASPGAHWSVPPLCARRESQTRRDLVGKSRSRAVMSWTKYL